MSQRGTLREVLIFAAGLTCLTQAQQASAKQVGYVTNRSPGGVAVIDMAAKAVVATIQVGSGPSDIALTPIEICET